MPLIVHHPRAPHTWGKRTSSLVELVDVYPTIAELAGIPVDKELESIDGNSFASLFTKTTKKVEGEGGALVWNTPYKAAFTQYPRCGEILGNASFVTTSISNSSEQQQQQQQQQNYTYTTVTSIHNAVRCARHSKQQFALMGYSVRTEHWRYTEWARWDGHALAPLWDALETRVQPDALVELYDHRGDTGRDGAKMWDDFENENVAAQHPDEVLAHAKRLREFVALEANRRRKQT